MLGSFLYAVWKSRFEKYVKYKTAGYHRHILRLPNVVKTQFWMMNTFSSYFLILPTFKIFWFFCQINLIMRAENKFLRNISILYAFYSKFTTFSDFKKVKILFLKTHLFVKKNPNFVRFEKFYYFSRILRQIWYVLMKKIDIQTREQQMSVRLRELN